MSTMTKVLFLILYIWAGYSMYEQHRISKTFDGAIAAMAQGTVKETLVVEDAE